MLLQAKMVMHNANCEKKEMEQTIWQLVSKRVDRRENNGLSISDQGLRSLDALRV
jgi:hypothetical protein